MGWWWLTIMVVVLLVLVWGVVFIGSGAGLCAAACDGVLVSIRNDFG